MRGQDHVVTALRNAVRTGTEGHAYLFSGPRGTGKTSTARILAKALNCEHPVDGEPDCECSSCLDIDVGRSFDLFELDAASNNGVDAIRDLIERSVVASPGKTKVYILDEVHMLSTAASNALLKTLEEPPSHVRFVLATTDPQKVLSTIRSRTQHFEFQLLSAHDLTEYVRWIADDADLKVDDEAIAHVVRQGRGSARDTLSALDQVVAAGGVLVRSEPVDALLEALATHDSGGAIAAVADALSQGADPRVLGDALLGVLRDAFLMSLDVDVAHLVDADRDRIGDWARRLGTPALTRAIEAVGSALVEMRQAADPRVPLEVALVRLTTSSGGSTADLLERIERLERAVAAGGQPAAAASGLPGRPPAEVDAAPAAPRRAPTPFPTRFSPPGSSLQRTAPAPMPRAVPTGRPGLGPALAGSGGSDPASRSDDRAVPARSDPTRSDGTAPTAKPARPAAPKAPPRRAAGTPGSAPPRASAAKPDAPATPVEAVESVASGGIGGTGRAGGIGTGRAPRPRFARAGVRRRRGADPEGHGEGHLHQRPFRGRDRPGCRVRARQRSDARAGREAPFRGRGGPGRALRPGGAAGPDRPGRCPRLRGRPPVASRLRAPEACGRRTTPRAATSEAVAGSDDEEPPIDLSDLTDAGDAPLSGIDKLTEAFPGAVLVDGDETK